MIQITGDQLENLIERVEQARDVLDGLTRALCEIRDAEPERRQDQRIRDAAKVLLDAGIDILIYNPDTAAADVVSARDPEDVVKCARTIKAKVGQGRAS